MAMYMCGACGMGNAKTAFYFDDGEPVHLCRSCTDRYIQKGYKPGPPTQLDRADRPFIRTEKDMGAVRRVDDMDRAIESK